MTININRSRIYTREYKQNKNMKCSILYYTNGYLARALRHIPEADRCRYC